MNKNPFLETLSIPYLRVIKRDVPVWKEDLKAGDYYEVEKMSSTRLYRDADNFLTLLEMSSSTLKIVFWIMYHIRADATSIRLDDKKLSELLGCTERQFRRVRTELIAKALIAKRQENEYWINPRYFAADSRLKLYKENTHLVTTIREPGRQKTNPMEI